MEEEFATFIEVRFADGSTEAVLVHRGDLESCRKAMDMVPAVAVARERKAVDAEVKIWRFADLLAAAPAA